MTHECYPVCIKVHSWCCTFYGRVQFLKNSKSILKVLKNRLMKYSRLLMETKILWYHLISIYPSLLKIPKGEWNIRRESVSLVHYSNILFVHLLLPLGCLRSWNKTATSHLFLSLYPRGSKEAELGIMVLGAEKSSDRAEKGVQ